MDTAILRSFFLAALALIASGCVSEVADQTDVAVSSGGSSYAECRAAAARKFPPKLVINQEPGYIGDRWVPCSDGSGSLCPPASAAYYADQGTAWDYNRTPRQLYFRRCLAG
ncbi:hypothetical protein [Hoeflea prorocentri]|uniref:Lipoprotein n=1 Tax=Hoeflea prorocentri TaxID=1922333 RepID=A0A9X3UPL0_9HYPH|nr:hypothetical protein [Hoeflea prorocentri]MCY6383059.1 hypothetical protein [Hoeflea prorocentri]MDA5400859.1 hypothetical protein [Hoeflea prorocentri]